MNDAPALLWPLAASIAIAGIHAYLGSHVLARGVIFADLAMAQIAALGAMAGILLGYDLRDPTAAWLSLGAVGVGAITLALLRAKKRPVPQEALFGTAFALALAGSILLADRMADGAQHLRYVLAGDLFSASAADAGWLAALYAALGVLHFVWRGPFAAVSSGRAEAMSGSDVRLWDFLFYLTLGIAAAQAVPLAGALLVFTYLLAPPLLGATLADSQRARLIVGWSGSVIASAGGLLASRALSIPAASAIVMAFGAALLLGYAYRGIFRRG